MESCVVYRSHRILEMKLAFKWFNTVNHGVYNCTCWIVFQLLQGVALIMERRRLTALNESDIRELQVVREN